MKVTSICVRFENLTTLVELIVRKNKLKFDSDDKSLNQYFKLTTYLAEIYLKRQYASAMVHLAIFRPRLDF